MSSLLLRTAAALAALFAVGAHAQSLPQVVITATRTERSPEQALVDITVIDRATIERSGAASLVDLLRSSPGVETSQNGGVAGLSGVFLRGTRTAQTLVLVDGVRLENPTSGGANLEFIPLASIERIEIVKGPTSSLYGSGAIGGVIQIFTRGASATAGDGVQQHASAALGSQGTAALSAGLSGNTASTRWSVAASNDRTEGFEATLPGSPSYQADRDASRRSSATASVAHRMSDRLALGFDARAARGRTAYDDAFSVPDSAVLDFGSDAVSVFARLRVGALWDSTLRLGETAIDYSFRAFSFAPRTRSRTITWQNSHALESGAILFGIEHLRQSIAGEGVTTGGFAYVRDERATRSSYVGYELQSGPHSLRANLRHDDIESVGAQTTGTLAYGWRASPNWRLRASAGTAFRAPTFDDLYSPFGANPDLRPERSRGLEFGAEYVRGASRIGLSAFSNRIDDAIELDSGFVAQNLALTRVRGMTLEAHHEMGALMWRAAVTLQDPQGEWLEAGGSRSGPLARRARHYATLGVAWRSGAWRLGAEVLGQGARVDTDLAALGAYAVLNADAAWRFTRGWEVFARATNLGERAYQTASGYASAPRQLMFGVRFASMP